MSYLVVIISFSFLTLEFHVTDDFILRKASSNFPDVSMHLIPPTALLDQTNGILYTVNENGTFKTEKQAAFFDVGWESNQYDLKEISTYQCTENGWPCLDIIELKYSSEKSPFGIGDEFKTISRICQIPQLMNHIKDERYYKFFGFYRTDIELPFKGIAIKNWIESEIDNENADQKVITYELKEIKIIDGASKDIESILNLPVGN